MGAGLWIVLIAFGLPLSWQYCVRFSNSRWLESPVPLPSPAYALKMTASGLFVSVAPDFWPCMWTLAGISLGCVIASQRCAASRLA